MGGAGDAVRCSGAAGLAGCWDALARVHTQAETTTTTTTTTTPSSRLSAPAHNNSNSSSSESGKLDLDKDRVVRTREEMAAEAAQLRQLFVD